MKQVLYFIICKIKERNIIILYLLNITVFQDLYFGQLLPNFEIFFSIFQSGF